MGVGSRGGLGGQNNPQKSLVSHSCLVLSGEGLAGRSPAATTRDLAPQQKPLCSWTQPGLAAEKLPHNCTQSSSSHHLVVAATEQLGQTFLREQLPRGEKDGKLKTGGQIQAVWLGETEGSKKRRCYGRCCEMKRGNIGIGTGDTGEKEMSLSSPCPLKSPVLRLVHIFLSGGPVSKCIFWENGSC